ncbi:MAG: hypothetical protein ACPGWR_19805 [Ardenticatenaceae bacterium]
MAQVILSDENCGDHARAIFHHDSCSRKEAALSYRDDAAFLMPIT